MCTSHRETTPDSTASQTADNTPVKTAITTPSTASSKKRVHFGADAEDETEEQSAKRQKLADPFNEQSTTDEPAEKSEHPTTPSPAALSSPASAPAQGGRTALTDGQRDVPPLARHRWRLLTGRSRIFAGRPHPVVMRTFFAAHWSGAVGARDL